MPTHLNQLIQSIARYIKLFLAMAGIYITVFMTHSTCSESK